MLLSCEGAVGGSSPDLNVRNELGSPGIFGGGPRALRPWNVANPLGGDRGLRRERWDLASDPYSS